MKTEELLKDWQANPPAADGVIHDLMAPLGCSLPSDYVEFLRKHNGGEGFVGKRYLIVWRAEELIPFNHNYEVDQYAPGLLMFGSSGGGLAYAFDKRTAEMPVVMVPFIGMGLEDAEPAGSTFTEFLQRLGGDDDFY